MSKWTSRTSKTVAAFAAVMMIFATAQMTQAQQLAHDYIDGKQAWPGPEITYSGDPIPVRLSTPWPPRSALIPVLTDAVGLLERVTDGKLDVKVFLAGSLVAYADGFKAARGNVSDIQVCFTNVEKTMPGAHVFELPFVLPSNAAAGTRIMQEVTAKYLKPEWKRQRVYSAGGQQTGTGTHFMSRKPIKALEDLKGVKVFASSVGLVKILETLGAVPVRLGFSEMYTGLERGTVDAIAFIDAAMIPFKFGEVVKNRTVVNLSGSLNEWCVNPKWFDGLPKDVQENVYLWMQFLPQALAQIATIERVDIGKYAELGVESYVLPEDEKDRWRKVLAPIVENWKEEASKAGMSPEEILGEIRQLATKYNDQSPDDILKFAMENPVDGLIDR